MGNTDPGHSISDEETKQFARDGFLLVKGVLHGEELARLRRETQELVDAASAPGVKSSDCWYDNGHVSGQPVLKRMEYVIDRRESCRALLGHPYILRSVEKLQGHDFFPTWDAMVLKMSGEGILVPWHQDAAVDFAGEAPIFNVDFYLDEATLDNCLYVYPGSHLWPKERVKEITGRPGFSTDGAVPVPMQPGDVIFHNILLVHGSPASTAKQLRRVIYYEFRPASVESATGPHTPEYIPLKQAVLMACLERRAAAGYAAGEETFTYSPPAPFDKFDWTPGTRLETFTYRHEQYWRKSK